jgi:hypothetical protein
VSGRGSDSAAANGVSGVERIRTSASLLRPSLAYAESRRFAALLARSFALAIIASTFACAPARKSTSPRITPDTSDVFVQT